MSIAERTFTVDHHPQIVFGAGVATSLADHVRGLGQERAFLVADPTVVEVGLVGPISAALDAAGIDHVLFTDVDPNPTDLNVNAGVDALGSFGEAAVVLIGGGSAMDCGKYVSLATANGGRGTDFAFHVGLDGDAIDFSTLAPSQVAERNGYPTIAIPTTSGTASETNGGGLITDTTAGRKLTFSHPSLRPRTVLLDPTLTLGLPPVPTATCGMDALTHSIECLTSTGATPYADGLALQAITLIGRWLPRAYDEPSDLEARAQVQWASHLAGLAFSSGPLLGLVHAMGHPISARLHQAHGQTLATLLPTVMEFNAEVCAERYGWVGTALGTDATPTAAIDAVQALSERVGTARSLGDLGGTAEIVPVLAEDALADLMILTTPRPAGRSDIEELYGSVL